MRTVNEQRERHDDAMRRVNAIHEMLWVDDTAWLEMRERIARYEECFGRHIV